MIKVKEKTVGFTGTQTGMTDQQRVRVGIILGLFLPKIAHHGDCIGADAEFHAICREMGLHIVGHPPIHPAKRAFCDFDEEMPPKEYLDRNHDIVDDVHWMIATPKEFEEVLRSGTWSTIRYAQSNTTPLTVILPDGRTWDGKTRA